MSSPPRLLVVAVDRLPAWILPVYGATWVAMPAVTALAGRGIVWDRLIVTGDDQRQTLHDLIGGLGPVTIVTDDPGLAAADARLVAAVPKHDAEAEPEATNLARLFAAAADLVASGARRLVVHATALGVAWDAPASFIDAYQDPDDPPPPRGAAVPDLAFTDATDPDLLVGIRHVFAAQLSLLDRCLEQLLTAAGEGDWTVLVVGLRGIGLGLHGRVGTGELPPFSELVHVPAILVDARGRMAGQRFGGLAIPADLGATLGELTGQPPVVATAQPPWQGRSLAAVVADWSATGRDRVVVAVGGGTAVITPDWHAIAAAATAAPGRPPLRLYAKPDDFFELCDVADRCDAQAEGLGRLVAAAAAGDRDAAWTAPSTPAAE